MFYHFLQWRFEPESGALNDGQQHHRLPPRLTKLLSFFVQRSQHVISKEDLVEHIWKDKVVNDDALSRAVAELRQIFQDDASAPKYIETVPRRGYRFIPEVTVENGAKKQGRFGKISGVSLSAAVFIFLAFLFTYDTPKSADIWQRSILNAQRITADAAIEYHPELSPSGKLLALSERRDSDMVVKIQDINGHVLHTFSEPGAWVLSPVWSPDEQQLAVVIATSQACEVVAVNLKTLSRKTLTNCTFPNASAILDWHPTGKKIAFVAREQAENAPASIYEYDIENESITRLTEPKIEYTYDTRPRYSPDGNRLAFSRGNHSIRNIYLKTLTEERELLKITKRNAFIQSFTWLNDSQSLIYNSNQNGDRNLWLWEEHKEQTTNLGARDGQNPSINVNNDNLLFQEIRYQANLVLFDAISDTTTEIVKSPKYDNNPAISPDGKKVAYTSNRFGKNEIWLYNFDTQQDTKLLSAEDEHLVSPFWSSDQSRLLVSSNGWNGYVCYEYRFDTRTLKRIADKDISISSCSYDGSGNIFAITRGDTGANKLVRIHDGNITPIIEAVDVNRAFAYQNSYIIFTQPNTPGIHQFNRETSEITTPIPEFHARREGAWSLSGNSVFYIDAYQQNQVWQFNLLTAEKQQIVDSIKPAIGNTISASQDGKKIVFSVRGEDTSNLFLSLITH